MRGVEVEVELGIVTCCRTFLRLFLFFSIFFFFLFFSSSSLLLRLKPMMFINI